MGLLLVVVALSTQSPDPLIKLARDGWTAARTAAVTGGSAESLALARRVAAEIEKTTQGTVWHLQGEYARALIAAAIAAAQNEHGELDLQLLHARDLSDRLKTSAYPARWPLPITDAEGELYLSVHRYTDAARAYRRGGNAEAACDAYQRAAKVMTGAPLEEARQYLKSCR
jgi:hypothetical protein